MSLVDFYVSCYAGLLIKSLKCKNPFHDAEIILTKALDADCLTKNAVGLAVNACKGGCVNVHTLSIKCDSATAGRSLQLKAAMEIQSMVEVFIKVPPPLSSLLLLQWMWFDV